MPLLVLFVFGAVVLGAGAMLSPAWPTAQPRVGLAATLALALIIGGAVFWAMAFGWDTLVIDYMLFALIIGIFLGGTLSFGQSRAEKQGEVLLDSEQGWPGPEDLIFLGIVALLLAIPPIFMKPAENTNTAQLGAAALAARDERTFDVPLVIGDATENTTAFYAPGYSALSAYLSQQLSQTPELVQFAVAAVIALLCVWLIYDLGAEMRDKYLGRAMAVALLFIPGFWMLYFNGHYTALLGLAFTLAFLTYAYRVLKHGLRADVIGAGLLLGATIIAEPNAFPLAVVGYAALLATEISGRRTFTLRGLVMSAAIGVIALAATAPWLINGLIPNMDTPRFILDSGRGGDVLAFFAFHGIGVIGLAALGAWTALRPEHGDNATQPGIVLALALGIWALVAALLFDYGAIIPLSLLAGFGLLWLWEKVMTPRGRTFVITSGLALLVLGVFSIVLAGSVA